MFSFRTTALEEQLDRSLRDGKVAVMEGDVAWNVENGRYTSDLFRERGNLIELVDWDDPDELRRADALVVDVQDCGGRCFEPLRRVVSLIDALAGIDAELRKDAGEDYAACPSLYIVDHPNPAGRVVEGTMPVGGLARGDARVPHRHGLTMGELCHVHYNDIGARFALHIISAAAQPGTKLLMPWAIPPAEDMAGMFTPLLYPGHVLWRWTSVTPALGTSRPYEMFGAPFLSHMDSTLPCPGHVSLRPCRFTPAGRPGAQGVASASSEGLGDAMGYRYAGESCLGWQVLLLPGAEYHSLLHAVRLIRHFRERYSEFVLEEEFWHRLADPVMEAYIREEIGFDIVEEHVKAEEQKWIRKAKRYLLYDEAPFRIK